MNLNIIENYQHFRQEVMTHWKTGVGVIGVAIVVGQIYSKVVAGGIILFYFFSYDMIVQPIRMITSISFGDTVIAVVIVSAYIFNVNPYLVIALVFALKVVNSSRFKSIIEGICRINEEMSAQKKTLEQNNVNLTKTQESFKAELEKEVQELFNVAVELKVVQDQNTEKVETLNKMIPEPIQDITVRLRNLITLYKQLRTPEMQALITLKINVTAKLHDTLRTLGEVSDELKRSIGEVDKLNATLKPAVSAFQEVVTAMSLQIKDLKIELQSCS